jgi:hypothetical protein
MQSFKDWLNNQDESNPASRAMSQPWAYPALYVGGSPTRGDYDPKRLNNYKKMVKRDGPHKKKKHHGQKKK